MAEQPQLQRPLEATRRSFLHGSAAAVVGGTLASTLGAARMVHAAENNTLKVGLIGCGGRGKGAAMNAVNADPNAQLTAIGDVFPDIVKGAAEGLRRSLKEKCALPDDHVFAGFDAYKQVIDAGVDVVVLASPPNFRPAHLRYAVEKNKHIFCEKPVAVDGPGVRSVLETTELAREKKLNLVSGLCWRYDHGVRETMQRLLGGAIGDIVAVQENYLTGTLWHRGRQPEWSDMEYQLRNWYYFTWLSGDHIVEQHVHSLDKTLWLMGDRPPLRCVGLGGRQVRTDPKFGNIFDHFAVCYEWENGMKMFSYTRQMANCKGDVEDYVLGTKGRAKILKHLIQGAGEEWQYKGPKPSMYDVEHQELFAAIRAGQVINNGVYMSYSTLLAIMGRDACYSGQEITWDAALNSKWDLQPAKLEWGPAPAAEVAVPGVTKFA